MSDDALLAEGRERQDSVDRFWDELARRLDESYEEGGSGSTELAPEEVPYDPALLRTKSDMVKKVCDLGFALLMGTHPRVGAESPVLSLSEALGDDVLQKICAYIARDGETEYLANVAKSGGDINAYTFEQRIGAGTYGKVYRGVHKYTGVTVAIKALDKARIQEQRMTEKVMRETKILQLLSQEGHPHVVRLYEMIETTTKYFMIMTHCPGGDFFDFLAYRGSVTESEARAIFLQILSGVEFCHNFKVVHRDLKPENLLIDADCNVKIADFSLANTVQMINTPQDVFFEKLKTSCGSPNYAAPEIVSGVEYSGFQVDIWSLGVILYSLVCGMLPFDDDNPIILFRQIKSGQYPPPPEHVSADCKALLAGMLAVDPKKRCTISQIRTNPWCSKHQQEYVCQKSIFAYAPLERVEEEVSDDSDDELRALVNQHKKAKAKREDSRASLGRHSSKGSLGESLAEQAGELEVYYKSAWKKTFLHHTIKGAESWMPLPGEAMQRSSNPAFPSPPWRYLTVYREKWGHHGITFAFNDGAGNWDNNGSPFKNYHVKNPGEYWIDEDGNVVSLAERMPTTA